ncbi:MAG: alkaline shock response membrane anchor protein AmaP [Acidaminococcales bacterium]|jgi:uncharacterized alkaline shock family protein YloU|nr:alkaline shock response membrane anchor protein AmaP [Acidaminococcales bacterium]
MHIVDRIVLAFYTLFIAAISLAMLCFALGLFPFEFALNQITLFYGRWEVAAAAAALFLVSLRLLAAGIGGRGAKELAVPMSDGGTVRISMSAVRKFVEKTVAQVRGVHNVKAQISAVGDELRIKLAAGVLPEMNVPETSRLVREKVKNNVKETIGREVSEVDIFFNTIAYDVKEK